MTTPYGAIDELFAECERPMHHIEVSGPALRDPLERMGVIPAKKVLTALRDARKLIADLTGEHDEMCATRREDSGHGPCDCGKDSYDLAIDAVLCVLDGGRSPFDPVIRERYETAAAVERGVRETTDDTARLDWIEARDDVWFVPLGGSDEWLVRRAVGEDDDTFFPSLRAAIDAARESETARSGRRDGDSA